MTRKITADQALLRTTTAVVAGVGLFAGTDSYINVYSLARTHGHSVASAAFLPFCIEGPIAGATLTMLAASRLGKDVPGRARLIMIGGVIVEVWANMASGISGGKTDALLAILPVLAFLGCVELLTWMRLHLTAPPVASATQVQEPKPGAPEMPKPGAPEMPKPGAPEKTRKPLADLLVAAELRYVTQVNAGKLPVLRAIQGDMRIGQGYAQVVQKHLKTLQGASLQDKWRGPLDLQGGLAIRKRHACGNVKTLRDAVRRVSHCGLLKVTVRA